MLVTRFEIDLQNLMLCDYLNIMQNPVKDFRLVIQNHRIKPCIPLGMHRSVENRGRKASHAVRYATRMLLYGCIPYGMQRLWEIKFSTERYIPDGMFNND